MPSIKTIHSFFSIDYIYQGCRILSTIEATSIVRQEGRVKAKMRAWAGPILGVFLFSLAIWVLHRELSAYHLKDILHHIRSIPASRIAAALLLTSVGYGIMTTYDLLALRYLKQTLAYGKIAMAAFIGAAFSNNIGLSMIAGASVRYRLYASWGLSALEITKLVFSAR